ncbi:hypothetical protein JCM11251_003575 [Rhodosporidiobolus azoricus]
MATQDPDASARIARLEEELRLKDEALRLERERADNNLETVNEIYLTACQPYLNLPLAEILATPLFTLLSSLRLPGDGIPIGTASQRSVSNTRREILKSFYGPGGPLQPFRVLYLEDLNDLRRSIALDEVKALMQPEYIEMPLAEFFSEKERRQALLELLVVWKGVEGSSTSNSKNGESAAEAMRFMLAGLITFLNLVRRKELPPVSFDYNKTALVPTPDPSSSKVSRELFDFTHHLRDKEAQLMAEGAFEGCDMDVFDFKQSGDSTEIGPNAGDSRRSGGPDPGNADEGKKDDEGGGSGPPRSSCSGAPPPAPPSGGSGPSGSRRSQGGGERRYGKGQGKKRASGRGDDAVGAEETSALQVEQASKRVLTTRIKLPRIVAERGDGKERSGTAQKTISIFLRSGYEPDHRLFLVQKPIVTDTHSPAARLDLPIPRMLRGRIVDGKEGTFVLFSTSPANLPLALKYSPWPLLEEGKMLYLAFNKVPHAVPRFFGCFRTSGLMQECDVLLMEDAGKAVESFSTMTEEAKIAVYRLLLELHKEGLAHGDFAERNVALARDGRYRLVDFEHAQEHVCEGEEHCEELVWARTDMGL